jgi:hypothetical protein
MLAKPSSEGGTHPELAEGLGLSAPYNGKR